VIGLVVVSHSALLAEGVADLVREVGGPEVRLRVTGGVDAPGQPLGTDPLKVLQAIEEVWSDDGVLVLMDLGSAVLSAETALDLLPKERRARVVLCEGPVVEGAVAAAVQARLGASLEQALLEACGALGPKRAQLGGAAPEHAVPLVEGEPAPPLRLTVRNPLGVHARPAARLVRAVGQFAGVDVRVENLTAGRGPVSALSLNEVAALGARKGHELRVTAFGPGARQALEAVRALAEADFGDVDETLAAPPPPSTKRVVAGPTTGWVAQGVPVSPGIAVGEVHQFRSGAPGTTPGPAAGDPGTERARLEGALARVRRDLEVARDAVARRAGAGGAELLDAFVLSLSDEALLGPARASIEEDGLSAAAAWRRSLERVASAYRALEDPYQQSRAADVEGVGAEVMAALVNPGVAATPPPALGILVAADLTPAEVARLDTEQVLGLALARGGPTSHAAILARALGIPALAAAGEAILGLAEGTPAVLDGDAGRLFADPPHELATDYARRAEVLRRSREEARVASGTPAVMRDGRRVWVAANVRSAAEARAAAAAGADGVGLLRTELLFLERREAPGEEEQLASYRAVAEAMGGRPVVIRTLDAGGDKPLPYLDAGREANPYLGWRAIRICLAKPELFKVQLRAIVRAAADHPVRVMFPMIATLAEWRAARALLEEARAEVLQRGQAAPARVEAGMMVEVPSAALLAERFAPEVDFFSIGTNDLTQYTLAAERGNPRLLALCDACQPAVLALVARVVEAAHARGKPVAVCGEAAGDPAALPLLVGLGVDELSVGAPAIPRTKQLVRVLEQAGAHELALRALALDSAEAVRALKGPR
jgi:phosphocarrier protein FPr